MEEVQIVPLRKKLISFAGYFGILHICLALLSHAIMGEIDIFFPSDSLTIDGADFTFLAALLGGFLTVIFLCINVLINMFVSAILFTGCMFVFNRLFYSTVADDGVHFKKYSNYIMLALMLMGFIVLNVIHYKIFPLSLIASICNYLIFSVIAYIITINKIKKTYT